MCMFIVFGNEVDGGGQCHFDDNDGEVSQEDFKRQRIKGMSDTCKNEVGVKRFFFLFFSGLVCENVDEMNVHNKLLFMSKKI